MSHFSNQNAFETVSPAASARARKTPDEPLNLLSLSGSAAEPEYSTKKNTESLLLKTNSIAEKPSGGVGNVVKQIGNGMADQVVNHPGELAFNGLLGAGAAGVLRVGIKVARIPTLGAAIAGGAYMVYDLVSQAPKFGRDLSTAYDPTGSSTADIKAAENGLQSFGRGTLNFAAGGLGTVPGTRYGAKFLETQTGKSLAAWSESKGLGDHGALARRVDTAVSSARAKVDSIFSARALDRGQNTSPPSAQFSPAKTAIDDTSKGAGSQQGAFDELAEHWRFLQSLERPKYSLLKREGNELPMQTLTRVWNKREQLADDIADFIPANDMRITAANSRAKLLEPFTKDGVTASEAQITKAVKMVEVTDDVLKLNYFSPEERALMEISLKTGKVQKELVDAFKAAEKTKAELASRDEIFKQLGNIDGELFAPKGMPSVKNSLERATAENDALGQTEMRGLFSNQEQRALWNYRDFIKAAEREGIDSEDTLQRKLEEIYRRRPK